MSVLKAGKLGWHVSDHPAKGIRVCGNNRVPVRSTASAKTASKASRSPVS